MDEKSIVALLGYVLGFTVGCVFMQGMMKQQETPCEKRARLLRESRDKDMNDG